MWYHMQVYMYFKVTSDIIVTMSNPQGVENNLCWFCKTIFCNWAWEKIIIVDGGHMFSFRVNNGKNSLIKVKWSQ